MVSCSPSRHPPRKPTSRATGSHDIGSSRSPRQPGDTSRAVRHDIVPAPSREAVRLRVPSSARTLSLSAPTGSLGVPHRGRRACLQRSQRIYRFQASQTSNARAAGISDIIVLMDDLFTGPLSVSPGSGPAGTDPQVRACRAERSLRPDTDMSRPGCCLQRLPGQS
jgi:hypothetical protein